LDFTERTGVELSGDEQWDELMIQESWGRDHNM